MADMATDKDVNTTFWQPYDCDLCLHGGQCRRDAFVDKIHCLCRAGFKGVRCQKLEIIDFVHGDNEESATQPGLVAGIVAGVSLLIVIVVIAFFAWRHYRKSAKNEKKEMEKGRMGKSSIEGLSVIGDRPTVKNLATPVCISIEETPKGNAYVKLPLEDSSTQNFNNDFGSHKAYGVTNSAAFVV